ncbi:hypothetical protein JZ751_025818 [Albula glossodonta]|uniref:Uncharacterized protein n=1 Tax=Albula glossodonta TaxID=121402 RepID=A0A8T2NEK0_9TELE|nr:hypothetical protein JZ751_025818 [Albula glossodonta]
MSPAEKAVGISNYQFQVAVITERPPAFRNVEGLCMASRLHVLKTETGDEAQRPLQVHHRAPHQACPPSQRAPRSTPPLTQCHHLRHPVSSTLLWPEVVLAADGTGGDAHGRAPAPCVPVARVPGQEGRRRPMPQSLDRPPSAAVPWAALQLEGVVPGGVPNPAKGGRAE